MSNKLTSFIFNKADVPRFQNFLNLTSTRHRLVSGNIANVSTPGYQSKSIDFKEELAKQSDNSHHLAGKTTHPSHIPTGYHKNRAPKVESEKVALGEVNSVDIDREISTMAQNELLYTIGARLLERKFKGLKTAITSK